MTVQELIDEITTKTGDSDTATEAKILGSIKDALRTVSRFVKERSIINRTTKALAADAQSIDISTIDDFREEYRIWIEVDGRREYIIYPGKDRFNAEYSTNASGRPELYAIHTNAKTMEFERKADQAYTINIEYFGATSSITTSTTLAFRDDVIKVIKDLVLVDVYEDREEDKRRDDHLDLGVSGADKLETDFHRQEDPDYIDSDDEY